MIDIIDFWDRLLAFLRAYLARYSYQPEHLMQPGDVTDPEWGAALKAMAARRLASPSPTD